MTCKMAIFGLGARQFQGTPEKAILTICGEINEASGAAVWRRISAVWFFQDEFKDAILNAAADALTRGHSVFPWRLSSMYEHIAGFRY